MRRRLAPMEDRAVADYRRSLVVSPEAVAERLEEYVEAGCASLFAIAGEMARVAAAPVVLAERDGTLAALEDAHARRLLVACGALAWTFAHVPTEAQSPFARVGTPYGELVEPLLQVAALLRYDRSHPWS